MLCAHVILVAQLIVGVVCVTHLKRLILKTVPGFHTVGGLSINLILNRTMNVPNLSVRLGLLVMLPSFGRISISPIQPFLMDGWFA